MRKRFSDIFNRKNVAFTACLFFLFIGVILIKMFLIELHTVRGYSMTPTLSHGEYVFIKKNAYGYRLPRNVYEIPWVGNIAYFFHSDEHIDSILSLNKSFTYIHSKIPDLNDIIAMNIPGNNHFMAIKRCVALPGDSIYALCDTTHLSAKARLFRIVPYRGMKINSSELNGTQFRMLSRNRDFEFNTEDSTFTALDDFIFVMGDNRNGSEDSRTWGPIPLNLVAGKLIE